MSDERSEARGRMSDSESEVRSQKSPRCVISAKEVFLTAFYLDPKSILSRFYVRPIVKNTRKRPKNRPIP